MTDAVLLGSASRQQEAAWIGAGVILGVTLITGYRALQAWIWRGIVRGYGESRDDGWGD